MKTSIRRTIFGIFVLLFLTTSTLIVLYASGYRFSPQHKSVVQTGILFVNSRPRQAQLYLNNKLESQRTPFRAVHLIPGSYALRIEKDGYYTWQKTLNVHAKETTFATELTLWRNNQPVELAKYGDIVDLIWHKHKLLALALNKSRNSVAVLELQKNNPPIAHWNIDALNVENAYFKSGTDNLIIGVESEYDYKSYIYFPAQPKNSFLIPKFQTGKKQDIYLDPVRDTVLYVQSGKTVTQFNINSKKYTQLATGTFLGVDGDTVWFDGYGDKGPGIYTLHLVTKQKNFFTGSIPNINLLPLAQTEQRLLLWDKKNGALYFAKSNIESVIKRLPIKSLDMPQIEWNINLRRWLIATEDEIWFIDSEGETMLIKRTSQRIKTAVFLNDYEYILVNVGDDAKIVELDDRNGRQTWTLNTLEKPDALRVNTDCTQIAFVAEKDGEEKVFVLEIR